MEKNMERFSEFNKNNKDNKFPETEIEKAEIKEIQVEEKTFFGKVKESAKYFFHIAPKKNFEKALRIVALATVLSAPIGEKAFAEREVNAKESTVITAQIDKEIDKLEQAQGSELFKQIIEQRQLLKEKYKVEIVGDNSEYTLEELQDFDEALEKVQKFAPKQFSELKIVLLKALNPIADMVSLRNLCKEVDDIKNINSIYQDLDRFIELLTMTSDTNYGRIDNYDIILICKNKKEFEKDLDEIKKELYPVHTNMGITYENMFIHELSHLISLNNPYMYEELAIKFKDINKKINESKLITSNLTLNENIRRYIGFVSAYAGTDAMGLFVSQKYKYNENENVKEDIAETMIYMVNEHRYANNDSLVQEKIKAIKEFLNKK